MSNLVALLVALTLVVGACGSDGGVEDTADGTADGGDAGAGDLADGTTDDAVGFDGPLNVVVANTPGTLSIEGTQRVMTALIGDGANPYLGGPDTPVTVAFGVDGETIGEVDGEWLTTNAAPVGLYVTPYAFDRAGVWEVRVSSEGQELGEALIEVVEESDVPNVGQPAPRSETPTATTPEGIEAISSDLEPDPSFYDLTVADAVANGRPTVVAFVTPAFCQTALCGPTMEFVKEAVAGRDELDVVHVEPYDLEQATSGVLEPIPVMAEWGLVTEPWVFVIDADGVVAATFEGIMGPEELTRAIDAL